MDYTQLFIAPSRIPEMIFFSKIRKTTIIGIPATVEAAIKVGQVKTFNF